MPCPVSPSARKKSLCQLIRQVTQAFLEHTDDGKPAARRESVKLRHELDCFVMILEEELLDPVQFLREGPLPCVLLADPASAPLTGTNS